ncbi:MAG: HAD family hydrolase [Proteobacteria bacterium]|nr:HAD family hydrolase [Pseudomonadota bacterium]
MTPKAVIFDLDDTLIGIYRAPEATWRIAVAENAGDVRQCSELAILAAIDKWREWLWATEARHKQWRAELKNARREIVRLAFDELGLKAQSTAHRIADRYSEIREQDAQLHPNAHETVLAFRASGIATALLTNGESEIQRAKIERFELTPLFDHIQVEGEAGVGKPEDGAYELLLSKLSVSGAEAWMVGDIHVFRGFLFCNEAKINGDAVSIL